MLPEPPAGLSREVSLAGETLVIRPIEPHDLEALRELVRRSKPEDVRARFHGAVHELPMAWAHRLTEIDYDREMALAAFHGEELLSVARLVRDEDGASAEFALAVRSDHQHRGLGHLMMDEILAYARSRGVRHVWGQVEIDNHPMLDLARAMGFRPEGVAQGAEVRVGLSL